MPSFEGEVTSLDSYNDYVLTVISQLKQNNKGSLSSALISYVMHLLLIVNDLTS